MNESETGATIKLDPEPVQTGSEATPGETKIEILSELKSEPTKMEVDGNG